VRLLAVTVGEVDAGCGGDILEEGRPGRLPFARGRGRTGGRGRTAGAPSQPEPGPGDGRKDCDQSKAARPEWGNGGHDRTVGRGRFTKPVDRTPPGRHRVARRPSVSGSTG